MSKKHQTEWIDIIERLKELSNISPEAERQQLLEEAKQEPRILDDKDVTLADIAKLAGIKEYTEPKVSKEAEKLIESITKEETKNESIITKSIKEVDAKSSISEKITKTVTEESKRLDKIAELEAQLAELKAQEKEEATLDDKSFREIFVKEITDFVKEADANKLVELYNSFSTNEVEIKEDNFLIKTPETKTIIADAEKAEAKNQEVIAEKEPSVEIDETEAEPAKCTNCDGTGKHNDEDCEECGGTGIVREAHGHEGQSEFRAHTIRLAGDFDPENPVSDADAQAVKQAIIKNSAEQGGRGIVVDVEPAEGAYDAVVVHTMRDKEEILGYMGDMVDEQVEVKYTDELSENKKPK